MEAMVSKEATIDVTSSLISEEQAYPSKRNVLIITNTDRNATGGVVYIDFGREAVVGQGVALYPTGTWSETIDNRYNVTAARVSAVASIANTTIAIHERIEG